MKNNALLVLVGSVGLVSCGRQDENQEAEKILRPVRTVKVEAPNLRRVRELGAVVDAARKADLSSRVSGGIAKLLIKTGDKVKKESDTF
ncbi:MAG: hypothetical protein ACE1Y4_10440 [Lysobacterales bacterium]